jgi:hypothetical protein
MQQVTEDIMKNIQAFIHSKLFVEILEEKKQVM